jgi:hypothetical protein
VTFETVEAQGVEAFHEQIADEPVGRSDVPLPARRQEIPKDGGKVRVLSIPAIRDADVMHLLKVMLKANGKQGVPQSGVISTMDNGRIRALTGARRMRPTSSRRPMRRRHELRRRVCDAIPVGRRSSCIAPQTRQTTTRDNRQDNTYLKREPVQTNRAGSVRDPRGYRRSARARRRYGAHRRASHAGDGRRPHVMLPDVVGRASAVTQIEP